MQDLSFLWIGAFGCVIVIVEEEAHDSVLEARESFSNHRELHGAFSFFCKRHGKIVAWQDNIVALFSCFHAGALIVCPHWAKNLSCWCRQRRKYPCRLLERRLCSPSGICGTMWGLARTAPPWQTDVCTIIRGISETRVYNGKSSRFFSPIQHRSDQKPFTAGQNEVTWELNVPQMASEDLRLFFGFQLTWPSLAFVTSSENKTKLREMQSSFACWKRDEKTVSSAISEKLSSCTSRMCSESSEQKFSAEKYEGNLTPLQFFFKTTRFLQSENSENCIVETFEYNQHFDMQN